MTIIALLIYDDEDCVPGVRGEVPAIMVQAQTIAEAEEQLRRDMLRYESTTYGNTVVFAGADAGIKEAYLVDLEEAHCMNLAEELAERRELIEEANAERQEELERAEYKRLKEKYG